MSYILDALRKAEAERERGSVPNIHAQANFAGAPASAARPRSRVWIAVAVVGVLLVIAAALPWFLMAGRSAGPVVASPVPVASPAPVATPTAVPAQAAVVTATGPAPTPQAVNAVPAPVTPALAPVRKPRVATAPTSTPASGPTSAQKVATAASSATEERIYAMNELPDDIRRQLPGLSVGGSMYSPTPASRLVIINGQVLHEGEHLTSELVLQQIRLKAAVFSFKGYRFTITF